MDYVVYILYSKKSGTNYTGYTGNLISRIKSHNLYCKGYTKHHRPWTVIYVSFYATKEEARQQEKYLKSGRGLYVKKEIISTYLAIWAHTLP